MNRERSDIVAQDPHAQLEQALIEEFLAARGHTAASLETLPESQKARLLREACVYASGRMTEVESRAHYIDDMHHGAFEES